MSRRILVLDGDCGAAVSIVQSLGRAGYHVTLAAPSLEHRAFRSRYVSERRTYPNPLAEKAAFQAWARAQHGYALVIPASELTLMPLHELRDEPALKDRVALPPAEATAIAFDKERVRALAEAVGIRVPANVIATSLTDLESPIFDEWLVRGAVVIKSVRSKVWDGGGGKELSVQMAVNREQLAIHAAQMLESGDVQLQQWVPGHGRGVEVLVDRGEIVLAFAHERLHEVPLTGGGSSYRRAIEPPADLYDGSQRLLRALKWHGVAMVEFRHDPETGDSYMMELNGRFWGSLPLAQFAGVDFPRALVELLLDGKRPQPARARPVYSRAFRRDLEWLKQMTRVRVTDLRRRGPPPPERRLMLVRPVARSLVEWGRILTGRESLDGAAADDPGPIAFELRAELAKNRDRLLSRWRDKRARRAAVAAWQRPLRDVRRVLVLCSGNICRSAYAGVTLAAAAPGLEVRSGGLVGPSHRPTPKVFAVAAAKRGVDLGAHRSHKIDESDVAWADLILIMDGGHQKKLAKLGDAAVAKSRWLGGAVAAKGEDPTIVDPIDFGADEVEPVLDHLDRAVVAVAVKLG